MATPEERIAQVFEELIEIRRTEGDTKSFSSAERAIWLIVSVRAEIDISGFAAVFEQLLSRRDLTTLIDYLDILGCDDDANDFAAMLEMLDECHYFGDDEYPTIALDGLPNEILETMEEIVESVEERNVLWHLDADLCALLDRE